MVYNRGFQLIYQEYKYMTKIIVISLLGTGFIYKFIGICVHMAEDVRISLRVRRHHMNEGRIFHDINSMSFLLRNYTYDINLFVLSAKKKYTICFEFEIFARRCESDENISDIEHTLSVNKH